MVPFLCEFLSILNSLEIFYLFGSNGYLRTRWSSLSTQSLADGAVSLWIPFYRCREKFTMQHWSFGVNAFIRSIFYPQHLLFWATLLSHIITFLFGGSVLSMIVHRLATSNSIMRSQYSVVHLSAWAQECSCCVNIIKLQHRSINMVLWMRHELSTTTYLRCISWSSGHMLVLHFGRLSGHRQISRDAI